MFTAINPPDIRGGRGVTIARRAVAFSLNNALGQLGEPDLAPHMAEKSRVNGTIKGTWDYDHTAHSPDELVALFGDIHGNLPALEACLEDMREHRVTRYVCLGDIVGYGAHPAHCLRLVASLRGVVLKGNHDDAAAGDDPLQEYSDVARAGVEYARRKLTRVWRDLLSKLPLVYLDNTFEACHAAPFSPQLWPYVLDDGLAMYSLLAQKRKVCFIGHTHRPMVWTFDENQKVGHAPPHPFRMKPGLRYLVNVGSVGQPRDDDWRASYVLFRPATKEIIFRRLSYELKRAQSAIVKAGLPSALSDRLELGR
jgi:diadenosine tetraphosphatase ApaH/serine/threonine PP2A family protein phosphatase